LLDWAKQFDDDPVEIELGPHEAKWSLNSEDMLEFVASLSSYPDGAGYGPIFIEAFEDSRTTSIRWVKGELERSIEYALANFALLYGAFSDSHERSLPSPEAGDTLYPFKVEDLKGYSILFNAWNKENRTEVRFINGETVTRPVNVPVLVLSGGADTLTPVEWAEELERRFSGLTRFVFPKLGHAVAFGTDQDTNDKEVANQLNCGPDVVKAFVSGESYEDCERYMRKAIDD